MSKPTVEARVEAWNRALDYGAPVFVVRDDGEIVEALTESKAWAIGGHSAVVKVSGIAGGYALERVIPRPA